MCACLLCTWHVHTWVESIVTMHVHGLYTDTPCAGLLCRVAGPTWSTPVTVYCIISMYRAYTCMLLINKTVLYTEFTYPVCSEVYKAHTCGHIHAETLNVYSRHGFPCSVSRDTLTRARWSGSACTARVSAGVHTYFRHCVCCTHTCASTP